MPRLNKKGGFKTLSKTRINLIKMAVDTKKEEVTIEQIDKNELFIDKYKKAILGAVVAVIVLIGAFFAYKYLYLAPREEKAEAAIFKGENYYASGAFNEALNGDNRGYVGFIRIINDYSGTKTANLANGYAGICYAQLGKYKEALEYLNNFDADDAIVAPIVSGAKGDCYVELGDYEQAVKAFLAAADKADSKATATGVNNTISPLYLMKAALVYEKQKNYSEALKIYNTVKEKYVASVQTQSGDVDKYIERATQLSGKAE